MSLFQPKFDRKFDLIVVGASWGGLSAISQLINPLPANYPIPIAVVEHRSKNSNNLLAPLLQDQTNLRVVDVEDKEPIEAGSIYIAPANYHMLVEQSYFSLTTDPVVRYSRPSIDVTFISASDTYQSTIGVVLTGANEDGSAGLKHIVARGGRALVQDPATAESPPMPASAIKAVPEAQVLSIQEISSYLINLSSHTTFAAHP